MNKLNMKAEILTCGSGDRKAVLDYESNLVYQYADPSNVLAYFEPKKGWIIRDQPYYSSGGWGRPSSGDGDGSHLIANARTLLSTINAKIMEVNSLEFLSKKEFKTLQKSIIKHNKLVKTQNEIAKKLGEKQTQVKVLEPIPTFKLRTLHDGETKKGLDVVKIAKTFKTALEVFVTQKGKTVKVDSYTISKDLVMQDKTVVAFRDSKGDVFLNSQVLQTSDFETDFLGKQSLIQKELRAISKYQIPFNILASANLKSNETKVLEQGPESTHLIKTSFYEDKKVERHFTGALLLENSGRKFLMDIDRIEIEHHIFNAFFVEVNSSVNTIAEAYDSMRPQAVKDAEAMGKEVKRQGEWFFIATDKILIIDNDNVFSWIAREMPEKYVLKHNISHGKGRPNSLYKPVGFGDLDNLVCGTVCHSGREHHDLSLGQKSLDMQGLPAITKEAQKIEYKLWEVVPNTTVGNFTITGDID